MLLTAVARPKTTPAAHDATWRQRWVIVGALSFTETVSWGILYYAFAVFLVPVAAELAVTPAVAAGAFSVALAVAAISGVAVGRWLDTRSPRLLMTTGSLLGALLVYAWSRVATVVELYLVFAGIGLAMAAALYEPAFIVITKWFTAGRQRALTTVTLIAALASFIFSPLSEQLITALGWRDALVVLAVALAVLTAPVYALLPGPPPSLPTNGPDADTRRVRLRMPGFYGLTLSFVLGALVTTAVSVHLVALLVAGGRSLSFAAVVAGLVGAAQIPGRLLFGLVGGRIRATTLTLIVYGVLALALSILAVDRSPPVVITFAVLFGMSAGMTTLLRATLTGKLYGVARYGHNLGLAGAFVTGARALAPLAAGVVAVGAGGYTSLLLAMAAASALAAVVGVGAVAKATAGREPN